jgi:hypothetical protein
MKALTELQTMAVSYREIALGKRPWTALGNFMNAWYAYHVDQRHKLVKDPIQVPEDATPEQLRWATFCAASVEYLCQQHTVPCPEWVYNQTYTLGEPWYHAFNPQKSQVRERLTRETPEPFTRRNIYCGNRMFMNTYERPAPQRRSA